MYEIFTSYDNTHTYILIHTPMHIEARLHHVLQEHTHTHIHIQALCTQRPGFTHTYTYTPMHTEARLHHVLQEHTHTHIHIHTHAHRGQASPRSTRTHTYTYTPMHTEARLHNSLGEFKDALKCFETALSSYNYDMYEASLNQYIAKADLKSTYVLRPLIHVEMCTVLAKVCVCVCVCAFVCMYLYVCIHLYIYTYIYIYIYTHTHTVLICMWS